MLIIKSIEIQGTLLIDLTIKGALSGLGQFLATESPLKMMKNTFISPQKLFPFS